MNKTALICVVCMVALAVMGVGFAMWADSFDILASADTGNVELNITSWTNGDSGIDQTCTPFLIPATLDDPKDVANTEVVPVSSIEGGPCDALNVTVTNAYPCYYNDIGFYVENQGSIPIVLQTAILTFEDQTFEAETGKTYIIAKDGENYQLYYLDKTAVVDGASIYDVYEVADSDDIKVCSNLDSSNVQQINAFYASINAVFEFRWGDNVGLQLEPLEGNPEESFQFHVVQSAEQDSTYNFSLALSGCQWNESPITPHHSEG